MSFDPAWLELRAPADRAARDSGLLAAAAEFLGAAEDPVAVDLGCGLGATLAAFAGRVGGRVRWRLVDKDARLLGMAAARCGGDIETWAMDLGAVAELPLEGARLVTASALLDLMPGDWIEALAARVAREGLAVYAALSYDGALDWSPGLAEDAAVREAFNRHQLRDKGLGPALGPAAGAALAAALERRGYVVREAASPWRLGPGEADLHRDLVAGIAAAAAETGMPAAAWAQARRAAIAASTCRVGHLDVLALPPGASAQSKTTSVSRP
ncbi:MAG TPA: class I SAM-dependent methyltransferase [Amaricoccus sp.]|uniref:class I SAM-dependent methyltransferase n=1 Tax=Amaricoccus sp. TaxID=1872485 RepID=UPI002C03BF69|nr:class I SAM-dependent methyltransferase [Amaricoccus sp.]HMQ93275.1 class I SAM-dependent methyltransferase [Amaricoccus sp.]HMR54301.1 class I SAM-dependent methyltransferase [Amaricoccus sp.]HMR61782.1 class I SAM-dependent methyltransferase [Amaricoccus sp.]HMU01274.1 class I SAM-dependent methyltransferase [Amaricoccus sp.]